MQVSEAQKGSSDDCMADDRNRYVMSLSSLAFQCRHTPMLERSGTMAHLNLEKRDVPHSWGDAQTSKRQLQRSSSANPRWYRLTTVEIMSNITHNLGRRKEVKPQ